MEPEEELTKFGRIWFRKLLAIDKIRQLTRLVDFGDRPGLRLNMQAELNPLLGASSRLGVALKSLDLDASPVRLIAFNKTQNSNWSVPWHQDRVIAVAEKVETQGYSNWSPKAGFWHCEAPLELLRNMVFARVHIDASTEENGPLELALGSHHRGLVPAADAKAVARDCDVETCYAAAGDVLIVHALTLHRSSSGKAPHTRRTLRIDYAPRDLLAHQLRWTMDE